MHPARSIEFDDLLTGLRGAMARDAVTVSTCPSTGLRLYCYSKSCVYDRLWDDWSLMARGLILDEVERRVVATPFPKFFNAFERGETIPDLPFEIFEKMDGSLIILFWHDGEWRCATKGSFISDQAAWAKQWIQCYDLTALDKSTTYLCEAIYPQNRIVIHYDMTALVLLAAYDESGAEWTYSDLSTTAEILGWPIAARHDVASISDLIVRAKSLPSSEEGYVIRFSNGIRLKIKGEEYLRVHRMVSRLTPLSVWEAMAAGDDLDAFRRDLPEEFWGDFDGMRGHLSSIVDGLVANVAAHAKPTLGMSDKDVGLSLASFPPAIRPFIFPYRNQAGDILTGRSRASLFRSIRPTGNRLPGWEPSTNLNRVLDEAVTG